MLRINRIMLALLMCFAPLTGVVIADIVTDWNQTTLMLNPSQGNLRGGRNLAMVHTALYDTIMAIDGGFTPYHIAASPATGASIDAAATTAAYYVLNSVFTEPAQQTTIQTRYNSHLASIPDGPGKDDGIAFGQSVAQGILALRSTDGMIAAMTTSHPDGTEPGQWRRTASGEPMAPGWGNVTPWAMTHGSQFDQGGPPSLNSQTYAYDYELTRALGAKVSADRTSDQSAAALFWSEHVPRHWHGLARDISQREGLSMTQNARLFALLSVTMADAQIAGWNMKYLHNFWRPETAIHLGDEDTNDDTAGDPMWQPFLMSPAFPGYVSGHSITSASAATLLELYFGSGDYVFEFSLMSDPSNTRAYNSFWEAAEEAGMSRIWGGIHFQCENLDGLTAGDELAHYVYDNFMVPEPATLGLLILGGLALVRRRPAIKNLPSFVKMPQLRFQGGLVHTAPIGHSHT